jgi:hypothetical protein
MGCGARDKLLSADIWGNLGERGAVFRLHVLGSLQKESSMQGASTPLSWTVVEEGG